MTLEQAVSEADKNCMKHFKLKDFLYEYGSDMFVRGAEWQKAQPKRTVTVSLDILSNAWEKNQSLGSDTINRQIFANLCKELGL